MKRRNHIASFALRDDGDVFLEVIGEDEAGAALVEEFELGATEEEDAPEDKGGDARRVRLGISN